MGRTGCQPVLFGRVARASRVLVSASRRNNLSEKSAMTKGHRQHARRVRYPETECRRQAADDCRLAACAARKQMSSDNLRSRWHALNVCLQCQKKLNSSLKEKSSRFRT